MPLVDDQDAVEQFAAEAADGSSLSFDDARRIHGCAGPTAP
jgi:hypothetical protein